MQAISLKNILKRLKHLRNLSLCREQLSCTFLRRAPERRLKQRRIHQSSKRGGESVHVIRWYQYSRDSVFDHFRNPADSGRHDCTAASHHLEDGQWKGILPNRRDDTYIRRSEKICCSRQIPQHVDSVPARQSIPQFGKLVHFRTITYVDKYWGRSRCSTEPGKCFEENVNAFLRCCPASAPNHNCFRAQLQLRAYFRMISSRTRRDRVDPVPYAPDLRGRNECHGPISFRHVIANRNNYIGHNTWQLDSRVLDNATYSCRHASHAGSVIVNNDLPHPGEPKESIPYAPQRPVGEINHADILAAYELRHAGTSTPGPQLRVELDGNRSTTS